MTLVCTDLRRTRTVVVLLVILLLRRLRSTKRSVGLLVRSCARLLIALRLGTVSMSGRVCCVAHIHRHVLFCADLMFDPFCLRAYGRRFFLVTRSLVRHALQRARSAEGLVRLRHLCTTLVGLFRNVDCSLVTRFLSVLVGFYRVSCFGNLLRVQFYRLRVTGPRPLGGFYTGVRGGVGVRLFLVDFLLPLRGLWSGARFLQGAREGEVVGPVRYCNGGRGENNSQVSQDEPS